MSDVREGNKEFFTNHLENVSKDLYNDNLLRTRCPFCKGLGRFLVRLDNGKWKCEECRARGNREEFEKCLGLSILKLENQKADPFTEVEQIEEPFAPASIGQTIKPSALDSDVMDGKPREQTSADNRVEADIPALGRKPLSKSVQKRQIKKLSARHYEIIEHLMLGERPSEIAAKLGIGRPQLSIIMNSPLFIETLKTRLMQISNEVTRLTLERCADDVERRMEMHAKLEAAAREAITYLRGRAQKKPDGWEARALNERGLS
jgi:hypothetical protein